MWNLERNTGLLSMSRSKSDDVGLGPKKLAQVKGTVRYVQISPSILIRGVKHPDACGL